jgi:Helix-turn-helix domain
MRMRQHAGGEPDAGDGGRFPPRVYADANSDASAGRDEQLGRIFRNMRLTMKVSRETIARRLATTTSSVDNFEAGAVSALPHGKETERIVRGYCELLRMDPEPILWRIRGHMQALASQAGAAVPTQPSAVPAPTTVGRAAPRSQPVAKSERTQARSPHRRRRARALFALSAPVALAAAVVYVAHAAPQPVYRAIVLLPDPVEHAVRAGLDYLVLLTAPRREGLRWIEVGDPRSRKADKLQSSTR